MVISSSSAFKMPTAMKITGRTSSITNAFVSAIIPAVQPTEPEVIEALKILALDSSDLRCAYCGDDSSEWDHLRPIVREKKPTGYISEIANLVPSCGKCNQSKGASEWKEWILGPARLSPATRHIADLQDRIARLEAFERWRKPIQIDVESAVGSELWAGHWRNHDRLVALMKECQVHADSVRRAVEAHGET
jgi:hypothetical protein